MSEARNHHYVPQVYLRNFAQGVKRQARVYVVDFVAGRSFSTLVRNVGAERDFNRVRLDGMEPNALETFWSTYEQAFGNAVTRVAESRTFAGRDRTAIVDILALLLVRNPRQRNRQGDILLRVAAETPEFLLPAGAPPLTTRQEIEDYLVDWVTPELVRTLMIRFELDMRDASIAAVDRRYWTLVEAAADAGDFITSDHPVSVSMPNRHESNLKGLGIGRDDTIVIFPLTRRFLLLGTNHPIDAHRVVDRLQVAGYNAETLLGSEAQIFAFDDTFPYYTTAGIKTGGQLAMEVASRRRSM